MARKINTSGGFNYYTGIAVLGVARFNPTNEQYLKITKSSLPYDLTYEVNAESGRFPVRVLFEILKSNEDDEAVGKFVTGTIYIKREVEQNKDKTKTLFVNNKGEYGFLANNKEADENMNWFVKDKLIVREAFVGEKDLADLIKKIAGFGKDEDFTELNKIIETVYKKYDMTALNKFIADKPDGLDMTFGQCGITAMLTVSVNTENGKKAQKVLLKEGYVKGTDISPDLTVGFGYKAVENIANAVNKQAKSGYPIKDIYSFEFQKVSDTPQNLVVADAPVQKETDDLPF